MHTRHPPEVKQRAVLVTMRVRIGECSGKGMSMAVAMLMDKLREVDMKGAVCTHTHTHTYIYSYS
jgi:hypothetical protein